MKRYKEEVIELREMANLRSKQTGLTKGTIYISTKEGNHGPRVKFYRDRPKESSSSASITISKDPELVEDSVNITSKEFKEVSQFILLNLKSLLDFWNSGAYWYTDEVDKFKKELKKITKV